MIHPLRSKTVNYYYLLNSLIIISILLIYFSALYKTLTDGFGGNFDDAYMFFRYAQNLVQNHQFAWNPGENPIYGPTSIPYVYVVAAFIKVIPLRSNFLLPIISWLIGLFVVILLFVTGLVQTKNSGPIHSVLATGCVAFAVVTPFFTYHATTGMDTTLSILINTLFVLVATKTAKNHTGGRIFFLGFLAYLSYAIRPDNIIYAISFPLLIFLVLEPSPLWRESLAFLAIFILFIAGDTLLKIKMFTDFLPLSYYVKQNNFYQGYMGAYQWNPSIYLATFTIGVLPSSIVIFANLKSKYIRLFITYLLPVFATFLYYFKVLQIMGEYARYYYPAMPFIVVLSLLILGDSDKSPIKTDFKKSFNRTVLSVLSIVVFVLFLGTIGSNLYLSTVPQNTNTAQNTSDSSIPTIGWGRAIVAVASLSSQLMPNTVLAASEVGYIGANAPQVKIIDLVGLNNPAIAHQGFKAEALFLQKPDLIWMPPPDYASIRHEIECNPNFYANYTYYPGLFDYGMAVNKESPYRSDIDSLLSKNLKITYPNSAYVLSNLEQDAPPLFCQ